MIGRRLGTKGFIGFKESFAKRRKKKENFVMSEFGKGKLHSGGSGKIVKDPKQAYAIAKSVAKEKIKK